MFLPAAMALSIPVDRIRSLYLMQENNMRSVPITRRRVMSGFAPHINAGHCITLAGTRYFVLTAAHAFETGGDGTDSVQASTLWLAQVAA